MQYPDMLDNDTGGGGGRRRGASPCICQVVKLFL
jgi:hypothetical protein